MTPDQLLTVFLILCALVVLIALAFMWHADQDAELGRELRAAAGSESAARMAIESANLERLLSQKYEGEVIKARRRQPGNVLPFRIVERGKAVHFEPGDAA